MIVDIRIHFQEKVGERMYEGDIAAYDLTAYGVEDVVVLKINKVLDGIIVASPVEGRWPLLLQHWNAEETLDIDYVIEYLYTIAPKTPPQVDHNNRKKYFVSQTSLSTTEHIHASQDT
jgi:hypothetical protein